MLIETETGIGPTLRVLRHFTERERFYQIKFQSGQRAPFYWLRVCQPLLSNWYAWH